VCNGWSVRGWHSCDRITKLVFTVVMNREAKNILYLKNGNEYALTDEQMNILKRQVKNSESISTQQKIDKTCAPQTTICVVKDNDILSDAMEQDKTIKSSTGTIKAFLCLSNKDKEVIAKKYLCDIGASIVSHVADATHLIVDKQVDSLPRFVSSKWVIDCYKQKERLDEAMYSLFK
jgi:hypothetical protein